MSGTQTIGMGKGWEQYIDCCDSTSSGDMGKITISYLILFLVSALIDIDFEITG